MFAESIMMVRRCAGLRFDPGSHIEYGWLLSGGIWSLRLVGNIDP